MNVPASGAGSQRRRPTVTARSAVAENKAARGGVASGAVKSRLNVSGRVRSWLHDHRVVAAQALAALRVKPLANLLTCLVIGIALALPASFFVGLDNVKRLTAGWSAGARMSVFLQDDLNEQQGRAFAAYLAQQHGVASVHYISPGDALAEFSRLSGFAEPLAALATNPLPAVVEVTPLLDNADGVLDQLQQDLQRRAEVALVQLDLQWVQRLSAMLTLASQMALALAMLLAIGVLLVIVNTIRLSIESRRREIVVAKLVGATDAFVRRPFLYTGLWYGMWGGILAWFLVIALLSMLESSVSVLAELYGSAFRLVGFSFIDSASLIFGGALLGWSGAWLAVSRHLGEIAPS